MGAAPGFEAGLKRNQLDGQRATPGQCQALVRTGGRATSCCIRRGTTERYFVAAARQVIGSAQGALAFPITDAKMHHRRRVDDVVELNTVPQLVQGHTFKIVLGGSRGLSAEVPVGTVGEDKVRFGHRCFATTEPGVRISAPEHARRQGGSTGIEGLRGRVPGSGRSR